MADQSALPEISWATFESVVMDEELGSRLVPSLGTAYLW